MAFTARGLQVTLGSGSHRKTHIRYLKGTALTSTLVSIRPPSMRRSWQLPYLEFYGPYESGFKFQGGYLPCTACSMELNGFSSRKSGSMSNWNGSDLHLHKPS